MPGQALQHQVLVRGDVLVRLPVHPYPGDVVRDPQLDVAARDEIEQGRGEYLPRKFPPGQQPRGERR